MRKARSARADTARAAPALGRVINETRALFHRLRLAAEQLHAADRLGERGSIGICGNRSVGRRPMAVQTLQPISTMFSLE